MNGYEDYMTRIVESLKELGHQDSQAIREYGFRCWIQKMAEFDAVDYISERV